MPTQRDRPASVPEMVAGIDIGGTKIHALLCCRDGKILASKTASTPARDGGHAISRTAAALVSDLIDETGIEPSGIGVGAAGVIDRTTGVITAASESFHDWVGFALADDLESQLHVPVSVENDVDALLQGELSYGIVAGKKDVLGIALGTGVGGAIALDGKIFTGPRGAGEIGHTPGYGGEVCTCGQIGHLETVASGRFIAARYAARNPGYPRVPAETVAARARAGDGAAVQVYADAGRAIGLAIATAANLLGLDNAVIGGGVSRAWDLLEPALTETLQNNQPVSGYSLTLHVGGLGGAAVALGAASRAWDVALAAA